MPKQRPCLDGHEMSQFNVLQLKTTRKKIRIFFFSENTMQQVRNVNAHFSNLPQNKNIGEKKYQVRCPTKNATVVAVWTVRGSCFFSNKILLFRKK